MPNRIFFFLLLAGSTLLCRAQVGIGTNSPLASAMLEVSSTSKGFLPPRLTLEQIKNINAPVAGLMVYYTEANKPCYYNGTGWVFFDNTAAFPQVGLFYTPAGGTIIYLDGSGLHGLAAASSDADPVNPVTWGCPGFNIPGAQFSAIGTGQSNSNAILAACATSNIAARWCDELLLNNFSDWYLPSIDELQAMYLQKTNLPLITAGFYWSSTQVSTGIAKAINFSDGTIINLPANLGHTARAVRSF